MNWSSLFTRCLTAAAAVAGAGSLVALLAWPLGSLGILDTRWPEPAVLGWDAGLSLLFFLQHSGMIRPAFRARLSARVPPEWHAAIYAIASGVALSAIVFLWQPCGTSLLRLNEPARWACR